MGTERASRSEAVIVGGLEAALGAENASVGGPSRQVVGLARPAGASLGLGSYQQRLLGLGALLHNVGMLAIPEAVVTKPGPLTRAERELVERHTIEGQATLSRLGGIFIEVGAIVRSTHERWDGGGYPDGLVGPETPIESRIIACADAFDAMTSERPYRPTPGIDVALAELRAGAGSQFDPRVVDAVVESLADALADRRPPRQAPPARRDALRPAAQAG